MDKPHKKLDVWQLALALVLMVYKATETFPKSEQFGLTNQLQRAAVSIPSNIAEGAARKSNKEFINFIHVAQGSLSELDTQLEIARRLNYLDEPTWQALDAQMERIDKMLSGLIRQQRSPEV